MCQSIQSEVAQLGPVRWCHLGDGRCVCMCVCFGVCDITFCCGKRPPPASRLCSLSATLWLHSLCVWAGRFTEAHWLHETPMSACWLSLLFDSPCETISRIPQRRTLRWKIVIHSACLYLIHRSYVFICSTHQSAAVYFTSFFHFRPSCSF